MTRFFIFIPILTLQFNMTHAQIPNGGFEHWVQESNYERPADWQTNQDSVYRRFEKDTVSIEGDYSLKILSEVSDPFEGCESYAYTSIALPEPLPLNSVLEFYVKSLPLDSSKSQWVFLNIITAFRNGGQVTSHNIFECRAPVETFTKIELPLTNEPADLLEIGISGSAFSSPVDGPCLYRSITWIDGMKIRSDLTGIAPSTISNSDIHIFPNPSNGLFEIVSNLDQDIHYELYSNIGQLLEKGQITESSLSVSQPGLYLLKLMTGQGTQHTFVTKLIVVN